MLDARTDAVLGKATVPVAAAVSTFDDDLEDDTWSRWTARPLPTTSFTGRVVRKDLVRQVKVGHNVPVHVLEFLLGQVLRVR